MQHIQTDNTDTTNALVSISISDRDHMDWDTGFEQNDTDLIETADDADSTEFIIDFAPYADYGITIIGTVCSLLPNVYYQGEFVKIFFDGKNNGDYFMYQSWGVGDIFVETVYDEDGNLIGVEKM